jgi:hypothetical protein
MGKSYRQTSRITRINRKVTLVAESSNTFNTSETENIFSFDP